MTHSGLNRALRQHVKTASLLGVEDVPWYRTPRVASRVPESTASAAVPAAAKPIDSPASSPAASSPPATSAHSVEVPAFDARQSRPESRAERAALLARIRARYEQDEPHRAFVTAHHRIVFDDGDPCARVMFIGEAPGEEEDNQGVPFVGRAGQMLNKWIEAMGLTRESVYIANVLKTRPPGNATPTPEQARLCAPYLYAQIAAVRPEAIITLGLPATHLILETTHAMARLRGSWAQFRIPNRDPLGLIPQEMLGQAIPVMPTYHPAYLLRAHTVENRQKIWSDLQLVMTRLGLKESVRT